MNDYIPTRSGIVTSIDLTPLIDVIFQILVFVLVSSRFVSEAELVQLPIGDSSLRGATRILRGSHLVTITEQDELVLNGEKFISKIAFKAAFQDVLQDSAILSLEIRGDREASLEAFVFVIEAANALGVTSLRYYKEASKRE